MTIPVTRSVITAKKFKSHSLIGAGRKRKFGEFKADHDMADVSEEAVQKLMQEKDGLANENEMLKRQLAAMEKEKAEGYRHN